MLIRFRSNFSCGLRRNLLITDAEADSIADSDLESEPELEHIREFRRYLGSMPQLPDYEEVKRNRRRKGASFGEMSKKGYKRPVGYVGLEATAGSSSSSHESITLCLKEAPSMPTPALLALEE